MSYIHCLVSFPVERRWTDPALVSYETAMELKARGWWVLVDPVDEREADIEDTYQQDVDRFRRPRD